MQLRVNAPDISCKSCANAITNALSKLDGIQQVAVDVPTKMVEVHFEEDKVTVEAILQRLDEAGFPATVVS